MSNKPEDPRPPGPLADLRERGDGFRTPDADYFARLADRVVATPPAAPARRRALPGRWWTAAAAVALLLTLTLHLRPRPNAEPTAQQTTEPAASPEQLLADLTAEDLASYLDYYPGGLEDELLPANPVNATTDD